MNYRSGNAVHEYAIVLSLVAALSIGVLKVTGGNLQQLLGNADASHNPNTQTLFALIGAKIKPGNTPDPSIQPNQSSNQPQQVTLKLDATTGQLTVVDGNNAGLNTSSVDGSVLVTRMSDVLDSLSHSKTVSGAPLPNDIQALLRQLSATGKSLGEFQQTFQNNQTHLTILNEEIARQQSSGQFQGEPYYNADFVQGTVRYTEDYMVFSNTYQQLADKLAADPAYATLGKKVADLAGGINSMTSQTVGTPLFSDLHITHVNPQDLQTALAQNPLAAKQFNKLDALTGSLPPTMQDSLFSNGVLTLSKQLAVGTPITVNQSLAINLSGLTDS